MRIAGLEEDTAHLAKRGVLQQQLQEGRPHALTSNCAGTPVAELLEEEELARHIRKMRRVYLERRDVLVHGLRQAFGGRLQVEPPPGGISLWAKVQAPVRFSQWLMAAAAHGVVVSPGSRYCFDRSEPRALRLVFCRFNPAELRRAVDILRACWPS